MKTKQGVEGIVYCGRGSSFLLLHRILNWKGWEFPKGGIEEGEDREAALLREIREETGLENIRALKKLPEKKEWLAGGIKYSYDVFLAEAESEQPAKLDGVEHDAFCWCPPEEVLGRLEHENSKVFFRKALKGLGTDG